MSRSSARKRKQGYVCLACGTQVVKFDSLLGKEFVFIEKPKGYKRRMPILIRNHDRKTISKYGKFTDGDTPLVDHLDMCPGSKQSA